MVKFDVSDIDKSATVNSAKLEMFVEAQPRTGSADANLYEATQEWVENEANWFKASSSDWWDDEGGDFEGTVQATAAIPSNAVNQWQEFDVTDLVQKFIEDPESNFGFHLKMSVAMVTVEYVSSESDKVDKRPKLTVNYDGTGNVFTETVNHKNFDVSNVSGAYKMYNPFSGNSQVKIFNVLGREIASFSTTQSHQWHNLPVSIQSGVHIFTVTNNGKKLVKRVWLQK